MFAFRSASVVPDLSACTIMSWLSQYAFVSVPMTPMRSVGGASFASSFAWMLPSVASCSSMPAEWVKSLASKVAGLRIFTVSPTALAVKSFSMSRWMSWGGRAARRGSRGHGRRSSR